MKFPDPTLTIHPGLSPKAFRLLETWEAGVKFFSNKLEKTVKPLEIFILSEGKPFKNAYHGSYHLNGKKTQ